MSVLALFRQAAYTGENRCLPCSAVNLVAVLLVTVALGALLSEGTAVVFLVFGCLTIYLRGYLVPGTPALTKRYLPDRVLARFDKAPSDPEPGDGTLGAHAGGRDAPDTMEALFSTGVVTVPDTGEDPRLTGAFVSAYTDRLPAFRDDRDQQRRALATVLDRDPDEIVIDDSTGRPFAVETGSREPLGQWVSDATLVADTAAAVTLSEVAPGAWAALSPAGRGRALVGARGLLEHCPDCGGTVRPARTTAESCCTERQVYVVRCVECETRLLEVDAGDGPGDDSVVE